MLALTFNPTAVRWLCCKGLGWVFPSVYWSRLSGLRLAEVAVPSLPGDDWVLLRTRLGGVCGTDQSMLFLRQHPASILGAFTEFPIIPGHENVAVVESVGPEAREWQVGTRVCVEPSLSCVPRGIEPVCRSCEEGRFCLCENLLAGRLPAGIMIGTTYRTSGSWATHFVAHQSQLHRVPESVPDEQAAVVDPLAGSLHGVLRRRPEDGEHVLVLGGGIIGLGVVASLRAIGCKNHVTAVVRHAFQRERMEQLGADTVMQWSRGLSKADRYEEIAEAVGGRRVAGRFGNQMVIGGFDVVYDCIGTGASLSDAVKFTRSRGTVVELGTSQISMVDTTALWFSEVTVIGAYGRQEEAWNGGRRHTYRVVFDLLESGKLRTEGLLTHVFDLRDYGAAFRALRSRGAERVVRVAFRPPESSR